METGGEEGKVRGRRDLAGSTRGDGGGIQGKHGRGGRMRRVETASLRSPCLTARSA